MPLTYSEIIIIKQQSSFRSHYYDFIPVYSSTSAHFSNSGLHQNTLCFFSSTAQYYNRLFVFLPFQPYGVCVGVCVWHDGGSVQLSRKFSPMPAFCDLVPRFVSVCTDFLATALDVHVR